MLLVAVNQSAIADSNKTSSYPETALETVIVTSTSEVANFEIYSEKHSQKALKRSMNFIIADLKSDVSDQRVNTTSNNSSI